MSDILQQFQKADKDLETPSEISDLEVISISQYEDHQLNKSIGQIWEGYFQKE